MSNLPSTMRCTLFLILVNAFLWLAFGVTIAFGAHPSFRESGALRSGLAISAFLLAAFLGALVIALARRNRIAYWTSIALLAAVAMAALFDEFGLADLAFVVITLLPLALLVLDRDAYLQPDRGARDGTRPA